MGLQEVVDIGYLVLGLLTFVVALPGYVLALSNWDFQECTQHNITTTQQHNNSGLF